MSAPGSANQLPLGTPNSSQPIGTGEIEATELSAQDSYGKPITFTSSVKIAVMVTQAWRYLFGTFVQRSTTVSPTFTLTAGAAYSQSDMQKLINQVEALSKVVGT